MEKAGFSLAQSSPEVRLLWPVLGPLEQVGQLTVEPSSLHLLRFLPAFLALTWFRLLAPCTKRATRAGLWSLY